MKIAMVSEHASPLAMLGGVDAGGQNVHVAALSAHLAARGHDVTVFTRRDDPFLPQRVTTSDGYVVEHVPAGPPTEVPKDELWPHMPEFSRYLLQRWSTEKFDIAHAHFWMSGAAASWAALPLGLPLVQTFHALGAVKQRHQGAKDTSPAQRIAVESRLCTAVDHVIATCRDEVAELTALGLDEERVSIVPCGVDTDLFRPQPEQRHDRHRLLVVGRLVERKGVADVVRALPLLPTVELVVAGGPVRDALRLDPEVQRLQALAEELKVDQQVTFTGAVAPDQMPATYAASDIVVAAPWYEPFGIVPLEAMACGRPLVGSAVGGLLDSVSPGVTGDLVQPRQPAAIASAVSKLLADPHRRARYGRAGVARANRLYAWPKVAARTEEIMRTVVATHRVPAHGAAL